MFPIMPFGYGNSSVKKGSGQSRHQGGLFSQNYLEDIMGLGFHADVLEQEDRYIIEAELPGVEQDNIDIDVSEHLLTITATKKTKCNLEEAKYHCRERSLGTFERSFNIKNINLDRITADFHNGVLKIELPKMESSCAFHCKIEIK